ncbi:MATE family efflux transporter [Aquitalea aquatilis]|uniref:MATE family efflux transporter n=1 Tax=Aquitalea aquatilis TaxID=1537400 RepID=UPI0010BDDA59|nr:MATE family efflux transporter [Aquitalea aquatilis]
MKKKIPSHIYYAISAWASKIITASTQLLCIRHITSTLGFEQYSTFALLSALLPWALLSDFGTSSSLQNTISERKAKNKKNNKLIFFSLASTPLLSIITIVIAFTISREIGSIYLRSVTTINLTEKNTLFFTTCLIYILSNLSTISYRVWLANDRGWISNIIPAISSALGLMLLMSIDIGKRENPILIVTLLLNGPSTFLTLCFFAYTAKINKINKFKILDFRNLIYIKFLLKHGWSFWIFSIIATLTAQSDYLVISQKLSQESISTYSIFQKLFTFIFFIYAAVMQGLWPTCTELYTQKKYLQMHTIARRYIKIGVTLLTAYTLILIILEKEITAIFSIKNSPQTITIILFGMCFLIKICSDTYAMLLQSMNNAKLLWYTLSSQAIISIILQWTLSQHYQINGVLVAIIISSMLTTFLGNKLMFDSALKITHRNNEKRN